MTKNNFKTITFVAIIVILLITTTACSTSNNNENAQTQNQNTQKSVNPHAHHAHAQIYSEEMFLIEMIPHHQEAIDTAKVMLNSNNEFVKTLSQDIIVAQSTEIEMMNSWITAWYPNTKYVATYENMMRPLNDQASIQRDKQFLEDMIAHHEAAVMMADQVLQLFSIKTETRKLAEDIITSQSIEIDAMRKELQALEQYE
jgi:uncharacterized protein (DUF305 family)